MALPSAQLGQLPGMNGPSYIPTVVVPKEPKFWERILLQTLAQAAGNVASQGITNEMSRDYADTKAGEKPATAWDKFWQGPTVNAQQKNTRDVNDAMEKRLGKQLNTELAIANMGRQVSPKDFFNRATQTAITEKELGSREKIAGMESGDRSAARTSEEKRTQAVIDAENTRAANALAVQKVLDMAHEKLLEEQATAAGLQNQLLKGAVDKANPAPKPVAAPPAPTPDITYIEQMMKSGKTPTYEGVQQAVQQAATPQYAGPAVPTPQEVLQELRRQHINQLLGSDPITMAQGVSGYTY